MSSETLREQIEKKLMLESSYIPDTDLIGVYCDNKECDVFNSNCNEAIIIDAKEN